MKWLRGPVIMACALVLWTAGFDAALAQQPGVIGSGTAPVPIQTEIIVPGSGIELTAEGFFRGKVQNLAEYIGIIYRWLIGIAGIVAGVFIMIGGFQYLIAGGEPSKISAAKERIVNALIGLALALGAFVILNTINPSLIAFKNPIAEGVQTELSYLPWCEELASQGVEIRPMGTRTGCGEFAKFTPPGGSGDSYCIYHGDCRLRANDSFGTTLTETCLQKPNLEPAEIEEMAKKFENGAFCVTCMIINQAVATNTLGFGSLAGACQAWMSQVNSFRATQLPAVENQPFWSYCAPADNYPGCVQADVNCQRANDNEDTGDGDCSDGSSECGCEGYDDQPEPRFRTDNNDDIGGEVSYGYSENETLDDFPKHLAGMCITNPCRDFVDPDSRKQSFIKGCKSGGGFVYTAQRAFRHGDFSFADCRNQ